MIEPTEAEIERAQLAAHKATGAIVSAETVRAILRSYITAREPKDAKP